METFFETSCTISEKLVDRSAIALGFFDGVHPGHCSVIQKAIDDARRMKIKAGIVTFKDHPRSLTRGRSPMLLTVIEKRLELAEKLGIDFALVLSFTEELCRLSPEDYVRNVLVGATGARSISVGHNHHFGKDREGDAEMLAELGRSLDFTVNVAEMVKVEGREVSSSIIRELVREGNMKEAALLLRRPFSVYGTVKHGDGRGKTIGFPTANLEVYEFQMLPSRGVYAGRARFGQDETRNCVINVGLRPTFVGATKEERLLIEAHLFTAEGESPDLYGKPLEVEFHHYLREEKKFGSKEALIEQIQNDKEEALKFFSTPEGDLKTGHNLSGNDPDHSERNKSGREERLHA